MLTNEQLTHIKQRQLNRYAGIDSPTLNDVDLLIAEVEQLTTHNRIMQVALAQLSDGVNWSTAPSVRYAQTGEWPSPLVDQPAYIWRLATNPQQLAERALVGDGLSTQPTVDNV